MGPETAGWGGGLPRERDGGRKVRALPRKFVFFGPWVSKGGTWDVPEIVPGCPNASLQRAQKGAKERKRAIPRENCKQPGLKQPGLELPVITKRYLIQLFRVNQNSYDGILKYVLDGPS